MSLSEVQKLMQAKRIQERYEAKYPWNFEKHNRKRVIVFQIPATCELERMYADKNRLWLFDGLDTIGYRYINTK